MATRAFVFLCTLSLNLVCQAHAYEISTHARLTEWSYNKSSLANRLPDFDLDPTIANAFGLIYYDMGGSDVKEREAKDFELSQERMPTERDAFTIKGWLMRGAIREDDLTSSGCFFVHGFNFGECNPQDDPYGNFERVYNHFYDPINNRGLTAFSGAKATDWAIGTADGNAFTSPNQPNLSRRNHFSVFDAREAMYRALTGRDSQGNELQPASGGQAQTPEEVRKAYWATTFRALGDVLHLIQDMAQPQHTRNEMHPGGLYEKYIDMRARGESLIDAQSRPVPLARLNYGGYESIGLPAYIDYFSTHHKDADVFARKGLADYSNRGFFTERQNVGISLNPYAHPSRNPADYGRAIVAHSFGNVSGDIELLLGNVTDSVVPAASATAVPLSSHSAWDAFLEETPNPPSYALNRYNFDAMAALLVPRAVGYGAGFLNYFFRGKLDFVPEPDAGQYTYRIVNLSPEDIEGKFALYYDAKDGKRYPVAVTADNRHPDDSKAWKLKISADPNGANNKSAPVTFIPPDDSDPQKAPAEPGVYMLVFNGDMGEEKAESGGIGAVAAKLVGSYEGALYIAGEDSQGNLITLKADRRGTRILNGPDDDGQIHSTPHTCCATGQTEFDPLLYMPRSVPSGQLPRMKQVRFGTNSTYQVVALFSPAGGIKYAWNEKTRRLENTPSPSWVAKDAQLGKFVFSFLGEFGGGLGAIVNYSRTYTDETGQDTTDTGSFQLPQLPSQAYSHAFQFYQGNKILISPDGRTLSGFQHIEPDSNGDRYLNVRDVRINLAPIPTAQVILREHLPIHTLTDTRSIEGEIPANIPPYSNYEYSQTVSGYYETANLGLLKFVDYLSGQLVTWDTVTTQRSQENGTASGKGIFWTSPPYEEWASSCPAAVELELNWQTQTHQEVIATYLLKVESNSDADTIYWEEIYAPRGSNYVRDMSDQWQQHKSCWGEGPSVLLDPVDNLEYANSIDPPTITGFRLMYPLTGKKADAVVAKNPSDGWEFRGISVTRTYVADSSPSGEVFFAFTDKSLVIHEPRPGGIKAVAIPSNMVKLHAALWL